MAAMSLEYNFKNTPRFEKMFTDFFPLVGIDPVTKKAVSGPPKEVKPEEETKT